MGKSQKPNFLKNRVRDINLQTVYLNLPPLEEEDSIDDTFEFSLVSNHHDDTVQEFGFPLYSPSYGSIPMMITEDFPRTTVSTYSEESDSNSNDSSSNDILQFYGLQCQNTNSMDNFVAEILSELEVRDFQKKNEKKSNRIDKCSRKMKELKIVLKRIDNKNKSFIIKENLSNSKKSSQTNELKMVLKRIGSDNKSFKVKEKLSNRK